jgi:formylglycine-generating enzyme required for sulfatase activity
VEKNTVGMELVLIPPGKFMMGSPASEKDRRDNEEQVAVTLTKVFYIGKEEVTQGQWRTVMGTTPGKGKEHVGNGDNFPVTYVNWDDAQEFCKKLSEKESAKYRLPTEAEWEYACRAGTTTRFCYGDDDAKLGEYAWYSKNAGGGAEQYAHEVGLTQPNPFELHDMHGNIREWCEDVYAEKLPGGTDPLVSTEGPARVYRGGGWSFQAKYSRSASRSYLSTAIPRNYHNGFRVVRNSGQ